MTNKLYKLIGVGLLVLALAVLVFSSGNHTENVSVDCPDDASTVSYERAVAIVSEMDGFFDEGCILYHVDNKPNYAIVEGVN